MNGTKELWEYWAGDQFLCLVFIVLHSELSVSCRECLKHGWIGSSH